MSTEALPNDGSGYYVSVGNKTVTTLRYMVSSVSSTTSSVGLSEIVVIGSALVYSNTSSLEGSNATSVQVNTTGYVPAFGWTDDIGLEALATASSFSSSAQVPNKAIDGLIGGYTPDGGDYTQEWASNGQGANAWLKLKWPQQVEVSGVVLYDRPNLDVRCSCQHILVSQGFPLPTHTHWC